MTSLSSRLFTLLALVVLCAALVMRAARPPAAEPATAPPTEFSAERAMRHVRAIAQRPHPPGTADHERVRQYLLTELAALGLATQVQDATGVGTRYAEAGRVRNVLARLPGRTPGGPAVVLMAHYDGVPGGPAAGDDAAGSATLLEALRALRAGPSLEHDVIALFTDGEEGGLLGAAAFVREHPWARDIGVALNFEARGTRGRSYMFETGPGNLDVARVLRRAGDVSATSLSVTVYRALPNDTDLSELAVLERPALNFAFADGVERYHTAHDDVAHLDPASVQHHGAQAVVLARAFGNGPLPRPRTGDAVFFDLPFLGLVVYPQSWAMPLALLAAALVLATLGRVRRGPRWTRSVALGAAGTIVAVAAGGACAHFAGIAIAALHQRTGWDGAPAFRGVYVAAIALLAVALAAACWAAVRRWASAAGAHAGALVVWTGLAFAVTWTLPGVSFLFTWPLIAAAAAAFASALARDPNEPRLARGAATWSATIVGAVVLVPVIYAIGAVLLGVVGPGAIAVGVLVSLLTLLLAPHLDAMAGSRPWSPPLGALAASLVLFGLGAATVRRSAAHPSASLLLYALDADRTDAWLAAPSGQARPGTWGAAVLGSSARITTPVDSAAPGTPPAWLTRALGAWRTRMAASPAPRVAIGGPTATVIADSSTAEERRIELRIRAAPGTLAVGMLALEPVIRATVDGRAIDTSRHRRHAQHWTLGYTAPPDSGFTLGLTVPAGSRLALELIAQSAGIPPLSGIRIPPRPDGVVPNQTGDLTVVRRLVTF